MEKDNIYECKLRGTLKVKNDKLNCIVGDIVEFDENEKIITGIQERKNFLHRPLLSNIDFIGILFSVRQPDFDIVLFQKMLLNSLEQNIPAVFIASKTDLVSENELNEFLENIRRIFGDIFPVFPISTEKNTGLDEFSEYISDKSITISGPSGVGKSTLINSLLGQEILATSEVSSKTSRGRHTTTESRFFKLENNTFIIDTPGFSSLDFPVLKNKKELEFLFPEFREYIPLCRFRDCIHTGEPGCAVKTGVENGDIPKLRYDFYLTALNSIFKKL